jgi:predicted RNase H-like HicB family nuclease
MSWNYRVIKIYDPTVEQWLEIHETQYDDAGNPQSYSRKVDKHAGEVGSETVDGLRWVLDRMREALDKPILTAEDFPMGHGTVELDREADGRWIGQVPELPGVLVYGSTEEEARDKVKALALHAIADRIAHNEQ